MGSKILLIDDEIESINLTSSFLISKGYEVISANDGYTALILFRELKPDLVILEALLPKMSGHEVAKEIRQIPDGKNVPLIILTRIRKTLSLEKSLTSNAIRANAILQKPFDLPDLLEKVQSFIGTPEPVSPESTDSDEEKEKEEIHKDIEEEQRPDISAKENLTDEIKTEKGSLNEIQLYKLLIKLHRKHASTKLLVKTSSDRLSIIFKNGELVSLRSPFDIDDSFSKYLVKRGVFSSHEIESFTMVSKQEGCTIPELLARLNQLTKKEIDDLTQDFLTEKLTKLFFFRNGSYEILTGSIPSDFSSTPIQIGALLFETFRNHIDEIAIQKAMTNNLDRVLEISPDSPFSIEELDLYGDEKDVLPLLNGLRNLSQILESAPDKTTAATLYGLKMMGVLRFTEPKKVKPKSKPLSLEGPKTIELPRITSTIKAKSQPEPSKVTPTFVKKEAAPQEDEKEIFHIGDQLLEAGMYAKAMEEFQKLVDRGSKNPLLYINLGWALYNNPTIPNEKRVDEALKLVNKGIRLSPRLCDGYLVLGNILKEEGDLKKAKANFLLALEYNPECEVAERELRYIKIKEDHS